MSSITDLSFITKVLERQGDRAAVVKRLHSLSGMHKSVATTFPIGHPRREYFSHAATDCLSLADLYKHAEHPYIDREESWHEMVRWRPPMSGNDVSISSPAGLCSDS